MVLLASLSSIFALFISLLERCVMRKCPPPLLIIIMAEISAGLSIIQSIRYLKKVLSRAEIEEGYSADIYISLEIYMSAKHLVRDICLFQGSHAHMQSEFNWS